MQKQIGIGALLSIGCFLGGCAKETHSRIVDECKAAGAGEVQLADTSSIAGWLGQQTVGLRKNLQQDCGTAEKTADSTWKNTTEGKICTAVSEVCVGLDCGTKKSWQ